MPNDTAEVATETKAKRKEPELHAQVMTDGRTVDFLGNRTCLKTDIVGEGDMPGVRFDFRNGETRTVLIDVGGLAEKLAQHGLKQKIGDEMAGLKDLDDCIVAVDELIDRLAKGNFNTVREAGSGAGASVLIKALAEVLQKDVAAIKTWLAAKDNAQKKALRNDPRVAPVIQRMEAEKAKNSKTPAVDTSALFAEIEAA